MSFQQLTPIIQILSKEEAEESDNTFQECTVIQKGAHRVCVDLWTDLSNKTGRIQNTKITQQSKVKEKEMERKGKINIPKAPDERLINEEDLWSPCRISFNFLMKL